MIEIKDLKIGDFFEYDCHVFEVIDNICCKDWTLNTFEILDPSTLVNKLDPKSAIHKVFNLLKTDYLNKVIQLDSIYKELSSLKSKYEAL